MMPAGSSHTVEDALLLAQAEGIEPNASRWLRFAGERRYQELQALNVRFGNSSRSYFAHATGGAKLVQLMERAEREFDTAGVYFIANEVNPAVATRAEAEKWQPAQKGQSTTDRDIVARWVMVIDVDAMRPTGTSATDSEMGAAAAVATRIHGTLSGILEGDGALAYGHSGNGRMVLVALEHLPNDEKLLRTVKAILVALDRLFSNAEAHIDPSVCDAKRLIPAWGTTKKKGAANVEERPHRRTALLCANVVERIGMADVERVLHTLREDLDEAGKAAVDKELGIKPATSARAATSSSSSYQPSSDSPFKRANECNVEEVAAWLGLMEGDAVRCPGCGESDGSSVVLIGNGLKCSHGRCSMKGKPPGFRTPVDLVVEVQNVSPKEAVQAMAERFGFAASFGREREAPIERSSGVEAAGEPPEGRFEEGPAEEEQKPPGWKWLTAHDVFFAPRPPPAWTFKGIGLAPGRPALFAGPSGGAKTIVIQSLAIGLATGRHIWNHFRPDATEPKKYRVAHVDVDLGMDDLIYRYRRVLAGYPGPEIRLEDLDGFRTISYPEPGIDLMDRDARAILRGELAGYDVCIMDALRGLATGSENDSEFRRALDTCSAVSSDIGCAFMLLHHTGKPRKDIKTGEPIRDDDDGAGRGTTAIKDGAGVVLRIDGTRDTGRVMWMAKPPGRTGVEWKGRYAISVDDIDVDNQDIDNKGLRVVAMPEADKSKEESADVAAARAMKQDEALCEMAIALVRLNGLEGFRGGVDKLANQASNALRTKGMRGVRTADARVLINTLQEEQKLVITGQGKATRIQIARPGTTPSTGTEGE